MKRLWIAIAASALAGGCGLLPGSSSNCEDPQPFQQAREMPPLQVPAGAVLPDTRNALRIPAVAAPRLPSEPGTCLDLPPSYRASPPAPG